MKPYRFTRVTFRWITRSQVRHTIDAQAAATLIEMDTLRAALAAETDRRITAERACWIGMCELTPWDGCGQAPCPDEAFEAMSGPSENYHRENFGKGKK